MYTMTEAGLDRLSQAIEGRRYVVSAKIGRRWVRCEVPFLTMRDALTYACASMQMPDIKCIWIRPEDSDA